MYKNISRYNIQALKDGMKLHNRYIIKNVLGVGGFGITYKGYDIYNKCICAVKELFIGDAVIRSKDGRTVEAYVGKERLFNHGINRFMEEASILNKLNGMDNVVRITDYFKENNTAYFVMEYVEGLTLKELMKSRGGVVPFAEASRIIGIVGKTLDIIHKNYGIFHRDISPDNILINTDGTPKIIDFGNAKSYMRNAEKSMSIVLKPGFAPPEQYTGRNQGPWTDVYSLAGVFYFITTGKKVPSSTERLAGAEYTSLYRLIPQCNIVISDAVDRGLNLDIKKRIQNIGEFVDVIYKSDDITNIHAGNNVVDPYVMLWLEELPKERWKMPTDAAITIGRDPQCSNIVILGDKQISKKHCLISYDGVLQHFKIKDISMNGIFHRGEKFARGKEYKIKPGTKLRLGKTHYIIEVGVQ